MKLYTIVPGTLHIRGNTIPVPLHEKRETVARERIRFAVSLFMRDGWLADVIEKVGGHYWHHPMPDGDQLEPEPLEMLAYQVAFEMRADPAALLCNCRHGVNRSALMAALVLRHYCGVSGLAAMNAVRTARPGALTNTTFAAYLDGLPAPAPVKAVS